ncbi:hypothetical protein VQ643_03290 [Pseudomonas sp. F1_0610]|uniref:hypothetical protein n=1 Tax=Pseudomonas sp. F1_0610 TaxID=3114284 RepID=UPI0039C48CA4
MSELMEALEDPVIIGFAVIILALIIAIIIGIVMHQRKINSSEPAYTLHLGELVIAGTKQYIAGTYESKNIFSQHDNAQDKLFLEHYKIGNAFSISEMNFHIARIQKHIWSDGSMRAQFSYTLYFTAFENIEFPIRFNLPSNKHISTLLFDKEGLQISCNGQDEPTIAYADLTLKARDSYIEIAANTRKYSIQRSELTGQELHDLEELLHKYAGKININQLDT